MSLILTEVSNAGIAMVADSAISMLNPATHEIEAHQKDWLKLLKVQRIGAALSYWGNIGAVSGLQPFDEWLATRIKSNAYGDLPSLADFLAQELNAATRNTPLPHNQAVGIHAAGNHRWQDDQSRPVFYHVHNGHGHVAIRYNFVPHNGQNLLQGIAHEWRGEPRRLFQAHKDFPSENHPLADNINQLASGYTTRNGDYFPYLLIADGLNLTRQMLSLAGVSLPRQPERLGSRLGYLALTMQTVVGIYERSSLTRVIDGHVTALGITRDNRYVAESTRKSKFVSRRAAQLGL